MALVVKSNGEAVVENAQTTSTAPAVTAANDTGSSEKVMSGTTGSGASTAGNAASKPASTTPDKVLEGMSFDDIASKLNQAYDSKWDEQIADLYNQIVQRKPFSYSSEDDLLYQQYKQRFTEQGKQAMRDTMGQAAALTGGYGSSYGQAVGQQQYDEYLKALNDKLPELYDRAYQRYAQEGDRLTQLYGLATDMDARDYSRFQGEQGQVEGIFKMLSDAAAVRGAAGDFGGYEGLFGADSADRMEFLFNAQTLMPLWEAGYIDAEKYKQITGEYPVGYVPPGSAASGGSGSDWGYDDGGRYHGGAVLTPTQWNEFVAGI